MFKTRCLTPVAMLALALAISLAGVESIPAAEAAPAHELTESDLLWLARIISSEARGESFEGQVAVGAVVLNRVGSPDYPSTVRGVIFQPGQFQPVANGRIYLPPAASAERAAVAAASGWDPSGGALFFFNPQKSRHPFMVRRPVATVIGSHWFTF
ncbi:MAG: cell wall hydrolase [bacterium]|nr:cell wall hydrolase [bacterium]